jgi:hypothetical protein
MLQSPEPACLVIADLSGYTGYLAGVELDHAQDILADLIGRVVKALRPPFRLAKLEGDAAFAYVATDKVDGSLLQDTIEATYFAFRRRQRDIRQATNCTCDACRRIPELDLKFVLHHGAVARQKMAGREELVGRDVILVHRLLKNAAETKLGRRAYALYTAACVEAMGIDPAAQGMTAHSEAIEAIGEVVVWLKDLEAAWQAEVERRRIEVTAADASLVIADEVPVPQQVVWEYATLPGRRTQWSGATAVIENAPNGRRGAGAVNHCMHGEATIVEEVLDWRPFEYTTSRYEMPMPGMPKILLTDAFIPLSDGRTRVETRVAAASPRERARLEEILPEVEPMLRESSAGLVRILSSLAASPGEPSEEPPLPVSGGRYAAPASGAGPPPRGRPGQ